MLDKAIICAVIAIFVACAAEGVGATIQRRFVELDCAMDQANVCVIPTEASKADASESSPTP